MNRFPTYAALFVILAVSSCAGPDAERLHGTGFELRTQGSELATVEHTGGGVAPFENSAERTRSGLQVDFGSTVAAGVVQVFQEDWNYPGFETYSLSGVLVGARGMQFVGEFDESKISLVMPWRVDASFAMGTTRDGGLVDELGYRELHSELGLGVNWNGLRLSLGASLSSIDGTGTFDSPQFGSGSASVRYLDLSGENLGIFFDVRYQPPSLPVYGNLRVSTADDSGTSFGLGVRF